MRENDPLLPLHIVAKRLHRQHETIRRWCRDGDIECVKIRRLYMVRESVVDSMIVVQHATRLDDKVARSK